MSDQSVNGYGRRCIVCSRSLPGDSMTIRVADSGKSGVTLADLCSFECMLHWLLPFVISRQVRETSRSKRTVQS